MNGALLVAGTTSDAGKSVVTAGICRWLARQGVSVAPFKAQNMSLNSMVTADGAEIGRAQGMQAAAAGVEPEAAMNPVLLKPGSDRSSHVVVLGRAVGEVDAMGYAAWKPRLLPIALECLADLRTRFDVVICEGAGSPAEINLRDRDIANMGLASAADLPVLVVGDIDRGGVFAALFGTLALLSASDQARVGGFVINKFRGDPAVLEPGLHMLRALTGRDVLGVLPWVGGLDLDIEDSLGVASLPDALAPLGDETLRVTVLRLPRLSNWTDVDALRMEPGVVVSFVTSPAELASADLVIVPGTRATVSDLAWLHATGLGDAVLRHAAAGKPVLGICGGYQMLGTSIDDSYESGAGVVDGLALLPTTTVFERDKVLGRPAAYFGDAPVEAYEIHHGRVRLHGGAPLFTGGSADGEGCRVGAVMGTTWHGIFDNDDFRRAFLADVAALAGRRLVVAPDVSFAALRERRLDVLADLVAAHVDTRLLTSLIEQGCPTGLPFVPPGVGAAP